MNLMRAAFGKRYVTELKQMLDRMESGRAKPNTNAKEINQMITEQIGPIAKLDKIQFTAGLPKTRSGKIMRRILRKIASKDVQLYKPFR